ncbi:MAG: MBOAT family protein [Lachnospiraceae bacterium]|nr:MBOAT family protein [Lachnospiraceae bacterium]
MLFNSWQFLLFFPIVLLLYYVLPVKFRRVWLLVCSLFFYACWNVKYLLLLIASILITYFTAILTERFGNKRKTLMIIGLIADFSLLVFFKYSGFLLNIIKDIADKFNVPGPGLSFDILLPVGISFYVFQSAGYLIDVYRGDIKAERNIVRYALFVSFFPQLVAGPIERSKNMLSQIDEMVNEKKPDFDRLRSGFICIMWGLFLKLVAADRLAVLADEVFDRYYSYGTFILILGAAAFSLQIYCDFASYSTIAAGSAEMLGFTLMENFETPYFSRSIREFWRRWHISLSTWFRDYLYIPLGGNRCSKIRQYVNIMITFLVSGLWHGADWSFVFWGGLHGLYQILGDIIKPVRDRLESFFHTDRESFGYKLSEMMITTALAVFAWIFFRAPSIGNAFSYIGRMFTHFDPWTLTDKSIYTLGLDVTEMHVLWASLLVILCVGILRYKRRIRIDRFICSQGGLFRAVTVYLLIMAVIIYGKYGPSEELKAFLYFRF